MSEMWLSDLIIKLTKIEIDKKIDKYLEGGKWELNNYIYLVCKRMEDNLSIEEIFDLLENIYLPEELKKHCVNIIYSYLSDYTQNKVKEKRK